jgi:hypothetical protein
MRKLYLQYMGILITGMAIWIGIYSIVNTPQDSRGYMLASLLLIVGVASIRKSRELHN